MSVTKMFLICLATALVAITFEEVLYMWRRRKCFMKAVAQTEARIRARIKAREVSK
jgi:hypothetical protein